jgi:hypothetical protein
VDRLPADVKRSIKLAVRELQRTELLDRLAQRETGHMGGLGHIGDRLLVVVAAPCRHQRVERIPIGDPIGFGGEARILGPIGRAHDGQPGGPLMIVARRDRGIAVACRQNADGGAVAVGQPLPRPAFPGQPGARQLGYRQRRKRLLDRNVNHRPRHRPTAQHRVHAGAGGGDPADERGLFADRAERRLAEIVHLAGQHAGDPAGEEQGQIARRIVRLWSGLPERRNRDNRRGPVDPAKRVRVMMPSAKLARAALA